MENRMIEFVLALRTLGVRVSVAESQDAFEATQYLGIKDRKQFQDLLRTTLIKEKRDIETFDDLFPIYFNVGTPPMINALEDLSPDQKRMLAAALRALLENLKNNPPQEDDQNQQGQPNQGQPGNQLSQLLQLLQSLLAGRNPSQEDMDQMGQNAGLPNATNSYQQRRMERRMQDQMGLDQLDNLLNELWDLLAQSGMSQEDIDDLKDMVEANREALDQQIGDYVNQNIVRQNIDRRQERQEREQDLTQRPFDTLGNADQDQLRAEMRRLAAQLRTRVALRQKRHKSGTLDVKRTIRHNMRNGNIPLELQFKNKTLKPKLSILCDVSGSMFTVARFMLGMIYELQDQTTKTRSFAFYYNIHDISEHLHTHSVDEALYDVMRLMPHMPYATDLGSCLEEFNLFHADAVDNRTTVIFVGDARNNFNDPGLAQMDKIRARAKQIIWLNPENPLQWGTGDSDMKKYESYCDVIHQVRNLAQLAEAIDNLMTN